MFARAGFSLLAIASAFALTVGTASTTQAQAQNPMVGNWTFNAAKSTSAAPLPKKRDVTITQKGADITVIVDEVAADGTATKWQFTTKGDGKPVPVTGLATADTATSTLTGRTGKTIYTKGGKPVMESNTEVSADGKVLDHQGHAARARRQADGLLEPLRQEVIRQAFQAGPGSTSAKATADKSGRAPVSGHRSLVVASRSALRSGSCDPASCDPVIL